MKKKLLLVFVLLNTLNALAKPIIGGQIVVRLYVDANCNKIADKEEGISNGFTTTLTGNNYNNTLQTFTREALFNNLSMGTYTATVNYNYTNANGTIQLLSGSGSTTLFNTNEQTISILLNPCTVPIDEINTCGQWVNNKITTASNFDIEGNTELNNNKNLTVKKYNTVLSFKGSYSGKVNGKNNNCTITGNIVHPDNSIREWANSFTITANQKGTYTINYTIKCGTKICESGSKQIENNTEEEKPLPKDLCGQWQNNTIVATLNGKTVGEYAINTRNNFDVALLNTELSFDGVYKWAFEKRTGKCRITGTIVEPDGNKINWTNNFYIKVRKPGTYTITYQIKCTESICESGVKVFTCNDVIVCNCAPVQDDFITAKNLGAKNNSIIIKNGDSILINRNFKTTFLYNVKCEGNVCDAQTGFQLYDNNAQPVSTTPNIYLNIRRPNGNYTLEVKGFCGGKSCTTLRFPVRIYGEDKRKLVAQNVRARWGNQIGINFGWPDFDKLYIHKSYVGLMAGVIADVPFGTYKRWHIWPAINIATAKYSGSQQLNTPAGSIVNAEHKQLLVRFGADLSYAIPIGKKGAMFHMYVGLSASGAVLHKSTYTALPTTSLAPWLIVNKSDSAQKLSLNFNVGIIVDINRTWSIAANYFNYYVPASKIIYTALTDRGLSLRLAWFYNQNKNGIRR
jgi:hypothetical protein